MEDTTNEKAGNEALRTIGSLKGKTFFVDSYQRGYKWTKQEVEDLIVDINSFKPIEGNEFYSLQPIVVREITIEIEGVEKSVFELVDGQQRLTTIFMILRVLEKHLFDLHYRTRPESAKFLQIFNPPEVFVEWDNYLKTNENFDNIDNYHFYEAFKVIAIFFKAWEDEKKEAFYNILSNSTKVIWYELKDKTIDSRSVFKRLNGGKIALTQAELLKAWFIQKETDKTKQSSIAIKWEEMERQMRIPEFRHFISGERIKNEPNAITALLKALVPGNIKTGTLFHEVEKKEIEFDLLQGIFECAQQWYGDPLTYNLAGYLLTGEKLPLSNMRLMYEASSGQEAFRSRLKEEIYKKYSDFDFDNLAYDENKDGVWRALMLFNVLSVSGQKRIAKFPFHSFWNTDWDIEHVHAIATQIPNDSKVWRIWIEDYHQYFGLLKKAKPDSFEYDSILEDIQRLIGLGEKLEKKDFDVVLANVSKLNGETDDSIRNLVLLDQKTNRGYKNGPFQVKRNFIIERENEGRFILETTRNAFLKYYTNNNSNSLIWGETDREAYSQAMAKTFEKFGITFKAPLDND